jgi:hypothetical protein
MVEESPKSLGDFESDPGYPFLAVSKEDKIKNASQPFDSKKNCWIPDEEDGQFFISRNYFLPFWEVITQQKRNHLMQSWYHLIELFKLY